MLLTRDSSAVNFIRAWEPGRVRIADRWVAGNVLVGNDAIIEGWTTNAAAPPDDRRPRAGARAATHDHRARYGRGAIATGRRAHGGRGSTLGGARDHDYAGGVPNVQRVAAGATARRRRPLQPLTAGSRRVRERSPAETRLVDFSPRVHRVPPETRRKTVPGARRRTSLCADGLGRDSVHARREMPHVSTHEEAARSLPRRGDEQQRVDGHAVAANLEVQARPAARAPAPSARSWRRARRPGPESRAARSCSRTRSRTSRRA